ncbi:P-loop containing nucleoside triphosphate hydrolase protein [Radiomyces spectabilis]|uniref:P-loop containing nucleoside triphosphate hydrolase protein n=1 Tax=Radiomyces spectabilis TaxID=64574 RepID=UPI00222112F5|nr:P-loop containing nucleoside triphosphate hydrolase protein [Radiomyces spectabilis]KAI8369318.1 P-loop containing nucleoside triphosphate hydrolase protein [Radiomyces spectabilis]
MDTRKRLHSDTFFDSDDDDALFLDSTADQSTSFFALDDYLEKKAQEQFSAHVPTDSPLSSEKGKAVDRQASSFANLHLSDSLGLDDLDYPESPPTQAQVDAMDIEHIPLLDNEVNDLPLFSSISNVQQTKNDQPTSYLQPPPTGSFVTATCSRTGRTLYFSKRPQSTQRTTQSIDHIKSSTSLLGKPIWKMLEELEHERKTKTEALIKEQKEASAHKPKRLKKANVLEMERLWVEKYKPRSFLDLLSDQRVNREVLRWVKQWDYCVFGKLPAQETQRDKAMKQYKSTFGTTARFEKTDRREQPTDPLLRPERKIMLISGPPGFGKTTLAHVVAKHANYNIIEVNASDDRTGDVVRSKIKSALEMQAIIREPASSDGSKQGRTMSMQQKPNILIIDEIDGASSGGGSESFIQQLVQLATADVKDKDSDKTRRKGKGKGPMPLLRPIICICNDPYAPVLRPLRAIAHTIQFRKISMLTIAKRLQEVCELEGLQSDLRTLSSLGESTDGDVRSCLNTLQFIRGKSDVFTRDMLEQAGVGRKDMGKSLFSVWEELFSAPNARRQTSIDRFANDGNKYLRRMIDVIMTNGEMEKIMQGCFESYPLMKFHDVALQKFVQMSEWLNFYDHVHHRTNDKHEYGFYGYLPLPIVNFHRFFAGSVSQEHRVEYPRVDYEVFATKNQYENLISIFLAGIPPASRRFFNKDMVANELIPRLLRIVSPEVRPVNKQLIKPEEKATLARLVEVMIEFGLTFLQEKLDDGQFVYKLEPPIEQMIQYQTVNNKNILPNRYAVRQLIAQEIETELLRRREHAKAAKDGGEKLRTQVRATMDAAMKVLKDPKKENIPKDFFGRPIVRKESPQTEQQAMEQGMRVV